MRYPTWQYAYEKKKIHVHSGNKEERNKGGFVTIVAVKRISWGNREGRVFTRTNERWIERKQLWERKEGVKMYYVLFQSKAVARKKPNGKAL